MRPLVGSRLLHPANACTVNACSSRHPGCRVRVYAQPLTCQVAADALPAPPVRNCTTQQHPAAELLHWATANGGMIHPALVVTDNAPCGCRGVVAGDDITLSSCQPMWQQHSDPPMGPNQALPLIAVPEDICMSSDDAIQLLSRVVMAPPGAPVTKPISSIQQALGVSSPLPSSQRGREPGAGPLFLQQAVNSLGKLLGIQQLAQEALLQQRLQQLQPPMLLALLLAHQRRLGQHSFWHSYISNLPAEPPCAWFDRTTARLANQPILKPQQRQLSSGTTSAGDAQVSAASTSSTLETAAAAVAAKCAAAADVFGAALGGLTPVEVAWAYGQVASRAFKTGEPGSNSIALLPVIDMLNHSAGAMVPACWLGSNGEGMEHRVFEGEPSAAEGVGSPSTGGYWCVWHQPLADWPHMAPPAQEEAAGTSSNAAGSMIATNSESGRVPMKGGDGEDDVIMRCGEELYISYMSNVDAEAALLSFGFIPPELQNA